jgi:xanthine dehydrogenase accessory factor
VADATLMRDDVSMFEVARIIVQWRSESRPVWLGRLLDTEGFSSRDPAATVAWTPGERPVGSIFSGAADQQVVELLAHHAGPAHRVESISVSDGEARAAGLSCGGIARILIHSANDIPEAGWHRLARGEASCLVTSLGDSATPASRLVYAPEDIDAPDTDPEVARVFRRGMTSTSIIRSSSAGADGLLVTAVWPVPTLLIVGTGSIADALVAIAGPLGWRCSVADSAETVGPIAGGLQAGDGLVVLSHDLAVAGPALKSALSTTVSYLGALGSRRTQAARTEWLRREELTDEALSRLHGPAGLDIGAQSPAEIAVAIIAEMCAVRTGHTGGFLSSRGGIIH